MEPERNVYLGTNSSNVFKGAKDFLDRPPQLVHLYRDLANPLIVINWTLAYDTSHMKTRQSPPHNVYK